MRWGQGTGIGDASPDTPLPPAIPSNAISSSIFCCRTWTRSTVSPSAWTCRGSRQEENRDSTDRATSPDIMSVGTREQLAQQELGRTGGAATGETPPTHPTSLGSGHSLLLDLLQQPFVGVAACGPSQVQGQQDTGVRCPLRLDRVIHALHQLRDQLLWGDWEERGWAPRTGRSLGVSPSCGDTCPSAGGLALTAAPHSHATGQGQQDPNAKSHVEHPCVPRATRATKILWTLVSPLVPFAFSFTRCPSPVIDPPTAAPALPSTASVSRPTHTRTNRLVSSGKLQPR